MYLDSILIINKVYMLVKSFNGKKNYSKKDKLKNR